MGQRKEKTMTNHLTAFSWGYEGWGSAPEKFVEAADAVEASRGFGPPMFVEVRFKRSGRAPGFKEKAFERLLGPERYRWMKGLGNAAIGGGTREIRIHDPSQAEVLLDLVERLAAYKRRVLFFCGCAYPGTLDQPGCHRVQVGELLLRAAERRGVPLTVVEWPGGEPVVREVKCDDAALAGIFRGKVNLDLPSSISLTEAAALPLGTQLHLKGTTASCALAVGAARYRAGKWQIPLYWQSEAPDEWLAEKAASDRSIAGVEARSAGTVRAGTGRAASGAAESTPSATPRRPAVPAKKQRPTHAQKVGAETKAASRQRSVNRSEAGHRQSAQSGTSTKKTSRAK